jgi:hypothetical protein
MDAVKLIYSILFIYSYQYIHYVMASRTTAKKAAAASASGTVKSTVMVSNVTFNEELHQMKLDLAGLDVSYVNAIRRVILSDIPSVVMGAPNTTIRFVENTSRMNNEILKHRLSCVPIHLPYADDPRIFLQAQQGLYVKLHVVNDGDQVLMVTTENLVVEQEGEKPVGAPWLAKDMFPPHRTTGHHIALLRLRPSTLLQQQSDGERIHLVAQLGIGTARNDSCFNVAHTCTFRNKQIEGEALKTAREAYRNELSGKNMQKDEIEAAVEDWNLLDAKRKFVPNAFEFTLESVGHMPPLYILRTAIDLLSMTLTILKDDVFSQKAKANDADGNKLITEPTTTMPLCYDVRLPRLPELLYPDYTIGKILESVIHSEYNVPHRQVLFCSFVKQHPHLELCYLRLALAPQSGVADYEDVVLDVLRTACKRSLQVFTDITDGLNKAM